MAPVVGGRHLWAFVVVAVGLAVVPALGARTVPTAGPQATLTLTNAVVNATWKESWLSGNVAFDGTVDATAELNAFLRRIDPQPSVIAARKTFAASPGAFAGTFELPNRALPGSYVVRVTGTSEGADLPPAELTVTIPAPPEGVVDTSKVSRTSGGPAARRVKGPVKQLFATFHFIVPPEEARAVRLLWRTPQFNFVGEVRKPYSQRVETFVRSAKPLAKGTWYCLLTVNEIVTKRVAVRIT